MNVLLHVLARNPVRNNTILLVVRISEFIGNQINQFTSKYINRKSSNHQNLGTDKRVYQEMVMEELMVIILHLLLCFCEQCFLIFSNRFLFNLLLS
jgi:hypothetical protein